MALARLYEDVKRRLDDSDAGSPLDFKYVTRMRIIMSTVGAWPYKQFGRHGLGAIMSTYNLVLLVMGTTCVISCAVYLIVYIKKISFFDMGHLLLCILLSTLYLTRMMVSRFEKYGDVIRDYLLEFHLFYFKSQSEFAAKVHSQIHIISGMITVYVMCQEASGVIFFTFMPWYNNYSSGMFSGDRPANSTFEHSVYFYCFTDSVYTTTKGYWVLFTFNIPVAYVTTIGMTVFDLIVCLIVLQIWGHLKILNYNLLHMPLPADSSAGGIYTAEENIQIRQLLRENIVHHKLIVAAVASVASFVDKCSNALSEYLLAFYGLMQVITCISLLEVSALTGEAIAKYGVMTVSMNQQLIEVSILFEMLNTKSEQLIQSVYAVPWECMDTSNRRTVQVFLHRVQTPVSLKAGKVVPVGVTTMSAVLKNTLSYFMLLKTVAGER